MILGELNAINDYLISNLKFMLRLANLNDMLFFIKHVYTRKLENGAVFTQQYRIIVQYGIKVQGGRSLQF